MNGFEQFLASILNPGGTMSAGRNPMLPQAMGAQPQNALAGMSAPQTAPVPMQPPPPPQQEPSAAPSGSGFGGILQNLFSPQSAQKNLTVQWLAKQGLDEGTATLLAGNK